MGVVFSDSFDLYDDTAIKWQQAGGSFDATPANVRTGIQSLKVQNGDAPWLVTNPILFSEFAVCLAWKPGALSGEVWESWGGVSGRQLLLQLNADGSLSVLTGAGPLLLGTSAPGVVALGVYCYITVKAKLDTVGVGYASVYVNGVLVLDLQNIVTGDDVSIGEVDLMGPVASFSWVDDFVFIDVGADWTNDFLQPLSIHAIFPQSDVALLPPGFGGPPVNDFAFAPALPHFSRLNQVPPAANTQITTTVVTPFDGTAREVYGFDFSGLSVLALVNCITAELSATADGDVFFLESYVQGAVGFAEVFSQFPASGYFYTLVGTVLMAVVGLTQNPITGLPWQAADFLTTDFGLRFEWKVPV